MDKQYILQKVTETAANVYLEYDEVIPFMTHPLESIYRFEDGEICTFMGYRMIPMKGGFILFKQCEWCGMTDGKLDKYKNCGHCGGYVY